MTAVVRRSILAAAMLVLTASIALVVGAVRLRTELQGNVEKIDASSLLRESGLGIRAVSFAWEGSDFKWFPSPTLVLRGFKGRFHSGRPGPGQVSARLDVDEVRIVSAWKRLFRGRVERIDLNGGRLECSPDILPRLPGFYDDFLDGTTRPIPWTELLGTLADTVAVLAVPHGMERSGLLVKDLEVSLLGWEILTGCAFTILDARAGRVSGGWDLWAQIEASCPGLEVGRIPIRIRGVDGAVSRIEAGTAAGGPALTLEQDAGGQWVFSLNSLRGALAQAILRGRKGLVGRVAWSGPWKLSALGRGEAPAGVSRVQLDLGPGTLSLPGDDSDLEVGVRGTVILEPGLMKVPELWLSSPGAGRDSARVEVEMRNSARGDHWNWKGSVEGILGLNWLSILHPSWDGEGSADVDVRFSSTTDTYGERLEVQTEGELRGQYSVLHLPWLQNRLSAGSVSILAREGFWDLTIDGKMGESPFELRVGNLAQRIPGGELWNDAAAQWAFASRGGRLEDFAVMERYTGGISGFPFWLALPGRGSARLLAGSVHGIPISQLLVGVRRTLSAVDVDTVYAKIAGGSVRGGSRSSASSIDRADPKKANTLRIVADSLDLAALRPALMRYGVGSQGQIRGRLSGQIDLQLATRYGAASSAVQADGLLMVQDGEIRDHPILEELRTWSGLDGLRSLPFSKGSVRFTHASDSVLIWEDLAIVSELLALEGAGTIKGGDTLWAVIRVEIGSDNRWADLLRSVLKPGAAAHIWIEGPAELPEFRVIGLTAYREARERIRGLFNEASGRRQQSGSYR